MKAKVYPVRIVVFCKDCHHIVATLMVEIEKPLSETTYNQRFWLIHEVLAEATSDGTVSMKVVEQHNLAAQAIAGHEGVPQSLNQCS